MALASSLGPGSCSAWATKIQFVALIMMTLLWSQSGGIRRSEDDITEDYDEIDRKSPPIFMNNTRTKVVVAADRTATLECRVRNLNDRAVSWIRKGDIHILTMGKIVYTTDNRFSVYYSQSSNNWILKLRQAQVEDSGIYECQVNTEPKRSKAYHLQVVESNARIVGDKDVMVQVGSDINLTCKAQDTPDPPLAVLWYKNGVRVDSLLSRGGISVVTESRRRSSHLLVSKVTSEDAGNYTCAPTNSKIDSVMVHVIQGADPRANVMAAGVSISSNMSNAIIITFIIPLGFMSSYTLR